MLGAEFPFAEAIREWSASGDQKEFVLGSTVPAANMRLFLA
jgi:hypothetical protein